MRNAILVAVVSLSLAACGGGGSGPAANAPTTGSSSNPVPTASAPVTGAAKAACDLATAAEVGALVGQDVTVQPLPSAAALSGATNCVYQTASGAGVVIGLNTRPGVAVAIIQGTLNQGGQAIPGIGDRAVLSQQGASMAVNAAKGDALVSVTVSGATVSAAAIEGFVRTLLGRL